MTIGEKLKKCRQSLKLTQIEVYSKTGIHNKTLSGYENNVSTPDPDALKRLAQLYNVSTDYLLGNVNVNNQYSEEKLDDDILVLNRAAKKMTPEKRKKLLDMAKVMFEEEFK